ncbi:DNA topoisomerase [Aestuariispira insulae]|uniref:DNA topoisomerase n=1 Tax=Aestuariispira insulae TaxID=1461337 RepID=A0A3D9HRR8_9PROT|nr:DNA topoisomerase [Aestuariispira insulae]RED52204.1 RecD/TraA family predicted helicase [Aestuariispira insulae]
MNRIIITEKTSQKKDLFAAIGNRYGQILPAEGHLLSLQEPHEVNNGWGKWSFDLLKPDDFYPTCPAKDASPSAIAKLAAIEAALKTAEEVIIATDCDREGQLIGEELLRHYRFGGKVSRAMFTAQDEKTLREAFENLQPNDSYNNLGQAALARQQADQVYNLSLTRAATVALKQPGDYGVIGIGRVKTPTLAIVCIRELEILNFEPQDYYHIVATANTEAGQLPLKHAPKEKILDPANAETLRAHVEGHEGPLSAVKKMKRTKPPKLLDLPELQKICARKWGWTADKTLEVAQELYDGDGKKIQTYPRAESRYLAENQIADISEIVKGLKGLSHYADVPLDKPEVRKGKAGHFSDAALKGVSHHAIIPNKNTMDKIRDIYPRLTQDEKKMFDLVASSYLAILMPDYVYENTTVSMKVPGPDGQELDFKITGNIPKELGWKAVYTDEMEKKEEDAGELPPVKDGDMATLNPVEVDTKKTKAPPRFNEGTLIDAMQNAWRFIEDKEQQEKLKEAKGIGTPATRAAIISGLKHQNFLVQKGKNIVPTDSGMTLYNTLKIAAPELVDPGVTAVWEMKLDDILMGNQTAREVWDGIGEATRRLIEIIKVNGPKSPKIPTGVKAPKDKMKGGKPTEKMLATAKSVAERKGLKLPKGIGSNFDTCREFLDEHLGGKPADPLVAIEKKLGSGVIKGVGPKQAKLLVEAFGADVYKIIKDEPEKLKSVKGISAKIVTAITDAVAEKAACRQIAAFLQKNGVAPVYAARLYQAFGEETLKTISENPYLIARQLPHLPFGLADQLARNLNRGQDRLGAMLFHRLIHVGGARGKDILLNQLAEAHSLSPAALETALDSECDSGTLSVKKKGSVEIVHVTAMKKEEDSLVRQLKAMAKEASALPEMEIDKALGWIEGQMKLTLTNDQKQAVGSALSTRLLVINGGPGTGRDTAIQALAGILKAKKVTFQLAGADNTAAKALGDATDEEAASLHKLLEWNDKTGKFKRTAKKPLDGKVLILRDPAKIDRAVMNAALKALPEGGHLVLVEDLDQRPAPRAGHSLIDLCNDGTLHTITLKSIRPGREKSLVLANAARVKAGEALAIETPEGIEADFFAIAANGPEDTIRKLIEVAKNRLPKKFKLDPVTDIQVITMDESGPLSPAKLNPILSQQLNMKADHLHADRYGWRFRVGDKLILKIDQLASGIAEGEIGICKDIDPEPQRATIQFGKAKLDLAFDELDILEPAYALGLDQARSIQARCTLILSSADRPSVYDALASGPELSLSIG